MPRFRAVSDVFFPHCLNYEVSRSGLIKHANRGTIQQGRINKQGYRVVDLAGKTFNLHRIVMVTYRPKPPLEGYLEINHKNHQRADCRLRNLEWVTHIDNIAHARRRRRKR